MSYPFPASPNEFTGKRVLVTGGTKGVGDATTMAVVTASISILVGDYVLTKFYWVIEQWL